MPSQRDLFEVSGPVHLTSVDWNCPNHQRSIAASLVQGVYVLERDRQQYRRGTDARAPSWYKHFHFEPIRILIDSDDSSIFGAIYQFTPPNVPNPTLDPAPAFVVAYRGTITKKSSLSRDLQLDLHILRNGLEQTSRFKIAMDAVSYIVYTFGYQKLWLAGHSLGSAMATLAGKSMAKLGVKIKTFLFNPPFLSAPIEKIQDKRVKHGIRITNSFITAGVATVLKSHSKKSDESFNMLASWVPNLYVNPADNICSEYIGYFEHRKKMEEIGAGKIGKIATRNSVRDLVLSVFGSESEPLHLFPSAILTVNWTHSPDFKTAHGIHQWWRPDASLEIKDHRYC